MEMQAGDPTATVRELGLPIYQSKSWLKFLGILSVVQGIVAACTIVGIIVAWLPIWVGVVLYQAASAIEKAHLTGEKTPFLEATGKLKLYFTIQGVFTLIALIIGIGSIFVGLGLGVLGAVLEGVR